LEGLSTDPQRGVYAWPADGPTPASLFRHVGSPTEDATESAVMDLSKTSYLDSSLTLILPQDV